MAPWTLLPPSEGPAFLIWTSSENSLEIRRRPLLPGPPTGYRPPEVLTAETLIVAGSSALP
eukprot:993874-Pyramimonas_sp.AAC.1